MILFEFNDDFFQFGYLKTLLISIILPPEFLDLVFLPLDKFVFCVLTEFLFVFAFACGHWYPLICFSLVEILRFLKFLLFLLLFIFLQQSKVFVEIFLALAEFVFLGLDDFRDLTCKLGCWFVTLTETIVILTNLLRFLSFSKRHHMSIEYVNLGHEIDDLKTVVGFLSKRISKQFKLLHVLKLRE